MMIWVGRMCLGVVTAQNKTLGWGGRNGRPDDVLGGMAAFASSSGRAFIDVDVDVDAQG